MKETAYTRIGEKTLWTKLDNGLAVCVVPKPGFAKKYAFFATRYGGMDMRFERGGEWLDTPAGIAHYLEHKMFDTEAGNALQELAKNGAEPNAFTSNAITAYYFDSTEHFYENLKILLSFVSIPYFTEESVAKEQGIIGQEIDMIEDNPEWQVYKRLMECLYRTSPARVSVAGSVESISHITAKTLYDCHKAFYTPSNMCLCVVGDVDEEQVLSIAREILPKEGGPVIPRDYGEGEELKPNCRETVCRMEVSMNEAPVQDRICLVTDDVPLPWLMREGHLNAVVEKAVALGLSPLRAVRYATINPAVRLRLYDVGGIAPGMAADLQLVGDLSHLQPSLVISDGRKVFEDGRFLAELPPLPSAETMRHSIRLHPVKPEDFLLPCAVAPSFQSGTALVNMIGQDGRTVRTRLTRRELPLRRDSAGAAVVETAPYLKMAVFNRYGQPRHGLALIDGMEGVSGAAALTYGHDSHNLTVFGGNDGDMALAANAVREAEGGLCAVRDGRVTAIVPLPLAGLLSEEPPQRLLAELENFLDQCRNVGFCHEDLMSFFTIMPLAVSPEIKCTDRGLLDVTHKRFLPLIERVKENV